MKKLSKIFFILCSLFLFFIMGCDNDDEPTTITSEGYVVGFDPCATTGAPYEMGEGLLIWTEHDSLLTYNFPKDIFNFSNELFTSRITSYYFPLNHFDEYKIRVTYRRAREEEKLGGSFLCQAIINLGGFKKYIDNEMIILQVESISD